MANARIITNMPNTINVNPTILVNSKKLYVILEIEIVPFITENIPAPMNTKPSIVLLIAFLLLLAFFIELLNSY